MTRNDLWWTIDRNSEPELPLKKLGKLKKREKQEDTLRKRDKTKPMKHPSNRNKLEAEGLIMKHRKGHWQWTVDGKIAQCRILIEEAQAARAAGLPWPPHKNFFREFRKLED
jgi:hypothetical protein